MVCLWEILFKALQIIIPGWWERAFSRTPVGCAELIIHHIARTRASFESWHIGLRLTQGATRVHSLDYHHIIQYSEMSTPTRFELVQRATVLVKTAFTTIQWNATQLGSASPHDTNLDTCYEVHFCLALGDLHMMTNFHRSIVEATSLARSVSWQDFS